MSVETLYKKSTYYLTTPLYYVNDVPHMGHAYCTIAADVLARYQRSKGLKVHFLTGTDEHGQKIEKAAEQSGETPRQLADRVVQRFQDLWKTLGISNDDFIRTTEERHTTAVQRFFKLVYSKDDIYLGEYEGWYCRPCETYYTETQLVESKCPSCQRAVERLKEESYFFRLSRYQQPLLKHIESNPDWIQPSFRRNEILSLLREPIPDLSISRTTCSWGIEVPDLGDNIRRQDGSSIKPGKKHYVYVWFDALLNYITSISYLTDAGNFLERWPADVHLIGKDILKFHAIIWPAMLMSVGMPLPKLIFGHGFILAEGSGEKMSKSKGNAMDPAGIIEGFGVDALRFFLLREISFGQDGHISWDGLTKRYNTELANDLGNLVSRSLAMLEKYFEGRIPALSENLGEKENILPALIQTLTPEIDKWTLQLRFNMALDQIWKIIAAANQYVDERAPWALAKQGQTEELGNVMYTLLETIRLIALLLFPYMPNTAEKIWQRLGCEQTIGAYKKAAWEWGRLKIGAATQKGEALFPRIELVPAAA